MLNINTNISSLITQRSLKSSTDKLNQAIERMTTGFKINHASDNAANYSISTNMGVKLSSYAVAEDNVAAGLDLLATASGSLDLISDKLTRLRALQEQAGNGTYGATSLKAINAEANSIVDEIERIYSTAEYNGIKLFQSTSTEEISTFAMTPMTLASTGSSVTGAFINEVTQLSEEEALAEGYTLVKTAEELQALSGKYGKFILMNDIDLSGYSTGEGWSPIQNLKGELNGNGYVVRNLYINRPTEEFVGLFGYVNTEYARLKNLGLENVNVRGNENVGGLYGEMFCSDDAVPKALDNCYVTGKIQGIYHVGGLIGNCSGFGFYQKDILNSYADVEVIGDSYVGGLIGNFSPPAVGIYNCFAKGSVTGNRYVGGLIGRMYSATQLSNLYALNRVSAPDGVGAISGNLDGTQDNIYYSSEISGIDSAGDGAGSGVQNLTAVELQALIDSGALPSPILPAPPTPPDTPMLPDYSGVNDLTLQVGIDSKSSSQITLNTSFALLGLSDLRGIGLDTTTDYLSQIDELLANVSAKQTDYGAVSNRLESALEEITTQYDNLVSSRSTLRDADIAKVSSEYIRQQILQQASATLLATANQTPSIALQLW